MDVHHPIDICVDQNRCHNVHVACKEDELALMLPEHLKKVTIVSYTTIRSSSKWLGIHEEVIKTMLPCPFQGRCILFIANHRHNACINLLGFNRIDDRLEVRSAARCQYGDAQRSCSFR